MHFLEVFEKLKRIWDTWDLRSFLILSFSFQCILIMMASMRKRTSNRLLLGLICLAYLLADWASYYAIGLIPKSGHEVDKYRDLHAFWAPFLLLHLGGPNTIAGFSVEDNELWKRSVLHFFVQAGMTLYIIYRALPSNPLRILALYYASMEKFRSSVAKDFGTNLQSLVIKKPAHGDLRPQQKPTEVQRVIDSYILFQRYKRVLGSLPIKFDHNLEQTKNYLLAVLSPNEAFMEMEIQMNLAYDIFYTKMWLIIEQNIGKAIHPFSLCCEATALVLWSLTDKSGYRDIDIHLTHTLVVGAVLVHVISFFKLILSDLMIPRLAKVRFVTDSFNKTLSFRRHRYGELFFSRWSRTMSQLNLMDYISKDLHKTEDVKQRVLKHIKRAATYANSQGKAEEMCMQIGFYMHQVYEWEDLKVILTCAGLVDALLVCHLATELLYKEDPSYESTVAVQISQYLMCLLVDEPMMVGSEGVGIKTIMFEDTCEYMKTIYTREESARVSNVKKELEEIKVKQGGTTMRRSMLTYAHYIKNYLKSMSSTEVAKDIVEDIWVELLCHMAVNCSVSAHLKQLSSGGELLTIVWLLMTYVGLTSNFEPDQGGL
ncbi:hypothetical protein V2J09_012167 [Rumex salicifolius]